MREMCEIKSEYLYDAIYEACFKANTSLSCDVFDSLKTFDESDYENNNKMAKIFANNSIANKNNRPLCQDTGQVVVFLEIGENVILDEKNPVYVVNEAVAACYSDNFFRKSVVKDAFFDRTNTKNNIPAIVYVDYVKENIIKANILIKGGGAENMSSTRMLTPSETEDEIFNYVLSVVEIAGENACPPLFLGVGLGGTIDYAAVLSKKAFFCDENKAFAQKMKNYINKKSKTKVADIFVKTSSTHIASMPICVTVNCHSTRHAGVVVNPKGYELVTKFVENNEEQELQSELKEINSNETEKFKNLEINSEILLTGTVYTARDAAHKKLVEMIEHGMESPFNLQNSIIFYAGPCPKNENEIIGPIGPTTSKRMDKFAPVLYDNGVLATIGKGERAEKVINSIKENSALYFSVQGGVASLLQSCVKSAEVIAFEELGAEAIYKLYVEKLPVKLEIK